MADNNKEEDETNDVELFADWHDSSQVTAYIPIRVLGRGAFGEAVLYRKVEDNTLIVWKEIDLKRLNDKERRESQNEIDILSILSHPNVISYYNHFLDGTTLLIEMEYANGGCLQEKISSQTELFAEGLVVWFFYQLITAMAYIHDCDVLHRDIKTLNIFLMKSSLVKIGDFGISKMLDTKSQMAESYVGTPYYMSPELIKGEPYNQKSDIWACGCVLYELLTLTRVYDATNPLRLASAIVTAEFEEIDSSYSDDMRTMLYDTLQKDHAKRPTAEELLTYFILSSVSEDLSKKVLELNASSRPTRSIVTSNVASEVIPIVTSKTSEVFCWGGGKLFPQKLDMFTKQHSPLQVSTGLSHFAVVTVENELYTWANLHGTTVMTGQLGHCDKAAYKAPKRVEAFDGMAVKHVSCGDEFTVCLTEDGKLYSFGSNYYGCIGCIDMEGKDVSTPVLIDFFNAYTVIQVSCGTSHVLALTDSKKVFSWGCGEFGRLGLGSEDDFSTPQPVETRGKHCIRSVHAGLETSFLITVNGRVLGCGSNEHNKLGFNNSVRGVGKQQMSYDIPCILSFMTIKPLSKFHVMIVSAGHTHTAAIDWLGRLITFGSNRFGQLGLGDFHLHSRINVVSGTLTGKQVENVACGDRFTVVSTSDNMIYSWGLAEDGRLGSSSSHEQGRGPNGQCFSFPRPIFGSLHVVSDIACCHWNTIIIAEKVLAQKTIRSTNSFPECKTAISQNSLASEEDGCSVYDDDYFASESSAALSSTVMTSMTDDSSVPAWLKAELEEAEFIAVNDDEDKVRSNESQVEIPMKDDVETSDQTPLQTNGKVYQVENDDNTSENLKIKIVTLEKENTTLREEIQEKSSIIDRQEKTIEDLRERLNELDASQDEEKKRRNQIK